MSAATFDQRFELVAALVLAAIVPAPSNHAFKQTCGPPGFINDFGNRSRKTGWEQNAPEQRETVGQRACELLRSKDWRLFFAAHATQIVTCAINVPRASRPCAPIRAFSSLA